MCFKIKIILFVLLLYLKCSGQGNLVPNGDFEFFTSCPSTLGQIFYAEPWFQPYTPQWSSEYYNTCCTSQAGVPINSLGNQLPQSGLGYAGIDIYSNGFNFREYIEVKLNDTLKSGINYCVRIYVSVSENWSIGCDGLGAYFSDDSILYSNPPFGVLNYLPQVQIQSGNIISDTLNWTLIEGEFMANGGEIFVTIGNFKTDAMTDTLHQGNAIFSHFYIDDVSVAEGSCNVGINEIKKQEAIFNPNPTTNSINLNVKYKSYKIYDLSGKMLMQGENKNGFIDLENIQPGIYFITAFTINGAFITNKLVKL
jgi:OmpA-OmpF porin, OOP family